MKADIAVEKAAVRTTPSIHPAARLGTATLKVADLGRSLDFYTKVVGLQVLRQEGSQARLGAGQNPILALEEQAGARPQPENTTGLYHAAILFPDRHALAVKVAQLIKAQVPFGQSDHLVSEAFYLSDPDGNGLELYRDRPREEWPLEDGKVRMAIDPIDFDSFMAEIVPGEPALEDSSAPSGTRLGHMHLRVSDIPAGEQFYHGVLGFDVTAKLPGALFLSAGGYHHHIGMNTWQSRGGRPPMEPSAGLQEFSISLPDMSELDRLSRQVQAAGVAVQREAGSAVFFDPFQIKIRLQSAQA